MLPHMVFSTLCCGCGPKEPVCILVHCVDKTSHRLLKTTGTTPTAEHHNNNNNSIY